MVRLGTPSAEPFLDKGFAPLPPGSTGDPLVLTKLRPQLQLRWASPAPRLAVLDLDPLPGMTSATVYLNRTPEQIENLKALGYVK